MSLLGNIFAISLVSRSCLRLACELTEVCSSLKTADEFANGSGK